MSRPVFFLKRMEDSAWGQSSSAPIPAQARNWYMNTVT